MFLRLNPALKARSPQDERRHIDRGTASLNPLHNVPGRPAKLPSLYPNVSLESYSRRHDEGRLGSNNESANREQSLGVGISGFEDVKDAEKCQPSHYPSKASRVKGTPLVLGATTVLRASAAAVAVGSDVASTAVQTVEENIDNVECEVRKFFLFFFFICKGFRFPCNIL